MQNEIRIIPITNIPEIKEGDNLADIIHEVTKKQKSPLEEHDILIITQKIVSKAEGRIVDLATIEPSEFAKTVAKQLNKDPRHCEIILHETSRIVRMDKGVLICETHHGFICANAGVDASNIEQSNTVCLLPKNPDESAKRLKNELQKLTRENVAVIISDTWGRPWREGQVNMAIGSAGIDPLVDYRGQNDTHGYELQASIIAIADELAGAAELVMGKTDGVPVAIVRGYKYSNSNKDAKVLLRDKKMDLFR